VTQRKKKERLEMLTAVPMVEGEALKKRGA